MLDKSSIIKLIRDFHESPLPLPIFKREIEIPLDISIKRAVTIIGPRRAGKSYLLLYTIKKILERGVDKNNILYINFEDTSFENAEHAELDGVIETYFGLYPTKRNEKLWLFFDEIQEIDRWEKFVRSTIDKINAQIFITGSSSKLLSKEIATAMRGRTISYRLLTLDFLEFLEFNGIRFNYTLSSTEESKIVKAATEYLKFGGYPEVALYKRERERILRELLDVTLQRDIVERYKVRNIKVLRLLIKTIAASSEFSIHKFFNFLKSNGYKVSKNTLYSYVQALVDAFLVEELKKYSRSLRAREQSVSKLYMLDNGLLSVNGASEGKLFENAVFNTLYRMDNIELSYYRDQSIEVDFVVSEKDAIKALVQASYNISDYTTRERELKALVGAAGKLNCSNLYLVNLNEDKVEHYKGQKIMILPLWKFMLRRKFRLTGASTTK